MRLILCTQHCHYNVIKRVCRKMEIGLFSDENSDWDIWWSDVSVQHDKVTKLKPNQRINALPQIGCLSRKNKLAQNLTKMQRDFGAEFDFFPKTWQLPTDTNDLKN